MLAILVASARLSKLDQLTTILKSMEPLGRGVERSLRIAERGYFLLELL